MDVWRTFVVAMLAFLGTVVPMTVSGPAAHAQVPELAQLTCDQLWLRRNAIFAQYGYCFTSPRGQAAFGKGCFPPYGKLPSDAQQQVNIIVSVEEMKGCAGGPAKPATRSVAVKIEVPIVIGGDATFDACSTTGVVTGLDPRGDGFLSVMTGPGGAPFKEFDRLHNGRAVFVCGEAGPWRSVIYPAPGGDMVDCGVSTPWAKADAYSGPCSYGWVHSKYLREVAG
jgi:hypothetical protein